MDLELKYKSLVDSLRLLASSYEKQEDYLPKFVVVQDEVISLFGDAFLIAPQLIEKDLLSNDAIASMIRCYNLMDMAIRNQETPNDFKIRESWNKVPELASLTLEKMNEELKEPDLSFVDWVDYKQD